MDLPNEMVFPVIAHHRNICRYPREDNQIYQLVKSAILEIVSDQATSANLGKIHIHAA